MKTNTVAYNLLSTAQQYILGHEITSQTISVNIASTGSKLIENQPLQCFHKHYKKLGGLTLPKDVINMAVQGVVKPQSIALNSSLELAIFESIAKQIAEMKISSKREIWRLTSIVTDSEYGFKVPFLKWRAHHLIS